MYMSNIINIMNNIKLIHERKELISHIIEKKYINNLMMKILDEIKYFNNIKENKIIFNKLWIYLNLSYEYLILHLDHGIMSSNSIKDLYQIIKDIPYNLHFMFNKQELHLLIKMTNEIIYLLPILNKNDTKNIEIDQDIKYMFKDILLESDKYRNDLHNTIIVRYENNNVSNLRKMLYKKINTLNKIEITNILFLRRYHIRDNYNYNIEPLSILLKL